MLCYQATVVNCLKCPADRKAKAASFTRQKEIWQFFSEANFRIRVVKINQAKRDVDNRHLHAKLDADTRTKITEAVKRRVVNTNQVVALHFAAQENLLETFRQAHRAAQTIAATESIDKLRFRQNLIVIEQQTAEAAFQIRRVSERQRRHDAGTQECVVS